MPKLNPLVSIIIPVYNGSDYLSEAIESAINQTYKNVEVIVVNDGSTDNGKTKTIAESYGNKIRYFEKENGGVASAFNYGIKVMNGEYFSWLSHDDMYYPDKLEKQIEYLNKNDSELTDFILYSNFDYINQTSEIIGTREIENFPAKKFRKFLLTDFTVNGNTVLIPKSCFKTVGVFNEKLKSSQDYDLWYRLSKYYPFIHLKDKLVLTRKHSNQGSKLITTFISEGINTKVKNLKEYTTHELLELFDEKEIHRVYDKLAYNYALRGGDKAGLPFNFILGKYKETVKTASLFLQFQYLVNSLFYFLLINKFSRKFVKRILPKKFN